MARCYQCGAQTDSYKDGSALCEPCNGKLPHRTKALGIEELNAALAEAREIYRIALERRREALKFKPSRDGDSARKKAVQNADDNVELAAMRFREALRDFVMGLKRDNT